jgi:hypothetical protein
MQASDDYTAHALRMLDNKEYRQAHPEYVILIAFSRHKVFPQRALMSFYTCIACLV